jgi:Leucine-rich repeat (LRR) protein
MLANKVNLRSLGLSNNQIGSGGAREIAAVCQDSLFGLKRLSLESNLIGNFGLIGLSKAMFANESLEELYLYNNEIDDDAMEKFSEMLSNKKRLRILGLECNKIRTRADIILDKVKVLPHFERLYLSQNAIQSTIGEAVYELLTRSRSLKELRLS